MLPVAEALDKFREAAPNTGVDADPLTARMEDIPPGMATVDVPRTPPKRTPTKVSFILPALGVMVGDTGLVEEVLRVVVAAPSISAAPAPDHSMNSHSPPVEEVVHENDPENAPVAVASL